MSSKISNSARSIKAEITNIKTSSPSMPLTLLHTSQLCIANSQLTFTVWQKHNHYYYLRLLFNWLTYLGVLMLQYDRSPTEEPLEFDGS